MRVGSRDNVWSEYGATRAPRRASDLEQPAPAAAPTVDRAEARPAPAVQERAAQAQEPAAEPRLEQHTEPLVRQRDPEPLWVRRPVDRAEDQADRNDVPVGPPRTKTEPGEQPDAISADDAEARDRKEAGKNESVPRGPSRQLTQEQEAEVQALRQRDTEVRAHEAAHMAAAGSMGGGASFSYQVGPDGRHYAVGGEVPVRTASAKSPEEAIRNAAQLRAAALAPAQPSAQDRSVAAEAAAMEAAARAELAARRAEDSLRSAEIATAASSPDTAPAPVDPNAPNATQATESKTVAGDTESARANERERMLQKLESEQRYQRSGWRHLHSDGGCGSCSSAVAAYR